MVDIGTLVVQSTTAEATARAKKIRAGIKAYLDTRQLIVDAYYARDHKALGYTDWRPYIEGEFGAALAGLDENGKVQAIAWFSEAGLSTRAIEAVAGVDHSTVVRKLQGKSGGAIAPPEPTSPKKKATAPKADKPKASKKKTGLDGKKYTPPKPRAKPRPPLGPQFATQNNHIQKALDVFDKLVADDRFKKEDFDETNRRLHEASERITALLQKWAG